MHKVFERVKEILLKPRETWETISTEEATISDLFRNYLILIAAIPVLASFIGRMLVGVPVPYRFGTIVRLSFFGSLAASICEYILILGSVWAMGKVIGFFAPRFGAESNDVKGVQVAMYTITPYLAAGVLNLIPSLMTFVTFVGLYGIYLLYIGLPIVMNVPKEKTLNYTLIMILAVVIFGFLFWLIDSAILSIIGPKVYIGGN